MSPGSRISDRAAPLGALLLCTYVFLLPVQIPIGNVARFAPSDLFLLAYLAIWFPWIRHVPRASGIWHGLLVALFGVGLAVALVRNGSVSTYALGQKTLGLGFLFIGYAALVGHGSGLPQSMRLLRWFVAGVLLHAVLATAVYAGQSSGLVSTSLVNYENVRVSGLLVDPNAFGGLVVVGLVLHVWTARTPLPVWPWRGRTAVSLVLLTALALTFSRSAWIALLSALVVAFLLRGRVGVRPVRVSLPLAIGAALTVALVSQPQVLSLALRPDQVIGRVDILRDATREVQQSPIFGIGLGSYILDHGLIVHNTPAWFLTEFGLLGLLVFGGFVTWYFRRLWRHSNDASLPETRAIAFAVLLAQVAMVGLSVGIEAFYQRHWWLLLAAAGALFAQSWLPEEHSS